MLSEFFVGESVSDAPPGDKARSGSVDVVLFCLIRREEERKEGVINKQREKKEQFYHCLYLKLCIYNNHIHVHHY